MKNSHDMCKCYFCPECGDDLMYETDCGISCVCGFETLDETEVELFA